MASTEYLGIYVYAGTGITLPAEGHEVSVGGSVGDYYGQIQLSNITEIIDLGLSPLPIEPVEVLPSAVELEVKMRTSMKVCWFASVVLSNL